MSDVCLFTISCEACGVNFPYGTQCYKFRLGNIWLKCFGGLHVEFEKSFMIFGDSEFSYSYADTHTVYQSVEGEINEQLSRVVNTNF